MFPHSTLHILMGGDWYGWLESTQDSNTMPMGTVDPTRTGNCHKVVAEVYENVDKVPVREVEGISILASLRKCVRTVAIGHVLADQNSWGTTRNMHLYGQASQFTQITTVVHCIQSTTSIGDNKLSWKECTCKTATQHSVCDGASVRTSWISMLA